MEASALEVGAAAAVVRRPTKPVAAPFPLEVLTGDIGERIEVVDGRRSGSTTGTSTLSARVRSFRLRPSGGPRGAPAGGGGGGGGGNTAPQHGAMIEVTLPGGRVVGRAFGGKQKPVKMRKMKTASSVDKKCVVM
jgi:hypothetical protein